MARWIARIAAIVAIVALAACSSIPLGTAGKLRGLDYLNDDLASLLLAFDVPLTLEPAPEGSVLSFDITTPTSGERHVKATLVVADAADLAGTLPPPAENRTYYLFGFSDPDKQAIRDAQAWARKLPPGPNALSISLVPRVCRSGEVDPARTSVSVLIALPGATGLAPLLTNTPLSTLLASAPIKALATCAGHSG